MSGAAAGPDWWNEDSTDDDGDAPEHDEAEPPLDNRTTQPMQRIERSEAEMEASPSPSPRSSRSADTVRVESPAWLLRAQKLAAEQNRAADPAADDAEGEHERSGDDEAALPPPTASEAVPPSEAATSPPKFLDPTIAASYREPRPSPDLAAGTIGLLGAAMLSIGSLLTWARSTGVGDVSVTGLTGSNGLGTLACGVVVGFCAVLVLIGRRGGLVGGAMLVAALAAVYLCGFSAVDILRAGDEQADILVDAGVDRETAEAATLELTSGFAIVAAGAAAALAAGTVAFARRV